MSLTNFELGGFWKSSAYAAKEYVDVPLTRALLGKVETALGYKLPEAYVELAMHQNGGFPVRTCHRTSEPTSWAKDHIAISGIYAIGETKRCSLLGEVGSKFWSSEWGVSRSRRLLRRLPIGGTRHGLPRLHRVRPDRGTSRRSRRLGGGLQDHRGRAELRVLHSWPAE